MTFVFNMRKNRRSRLYPVFTFLEKEIIDYNPHIYNRNRRAHEPIYTKQLSFKSHNKTEAHLNDLFSYCLNAKELDLFYRNWHSIQTSCNTVQKNESAYNVANEMPRNQKDWLTV